MKLRNNIYTIGDVRISDIVSEFGTPCYVYNAQTIINQYNKMQKAFKGVKVKLNYACKALNNINVLKLLCKQGAGLDAVSIQEVKLALLAGFKPNDILYTPNGVSFEELSEAVDLGVRLTIDNISILELFGAKYGGKVPVCIRINPHIMAGGNSHISVGHIDSKFGISYYQLRHVLRIVKNFKINVEGLHMHTGSDILEADVFLRGAELLFEAAQDFKNLKLIDFGSGFKVAYKVGDIVTDIEKIGNRITTRFKEFCKEYGSELELWFEPGKYLVSDSGTFLVNVNVIKQTISTLFVGVDSGQNHLLRPKLYDAHHEVVNVSNPEGAMRLYSVVGYICENDTLAYDRQLNEVREGDTLAIKNAGAYGFSMSSNYNSRFRPAEVMVINGKANLIRKRENFDDLMRNQVEIDI